MNDPNPPTPDSPTAVPASPAFLHGIFVGPEGLRFIWRLIAYYLLYRTMELGARFVIAFLIPPGTRQLWLYALGEMVVLIGAIAAAGVMSRVEKCPFGT